MGKFQDLTGNRYGRLIVKYRTDKEKGRNTWWMCECDCGVIKEVNARHLVHGKIKSCGCLRNEMTANLKKSHGLSKTPAYVSWLSMKNRCNNPNSEDYEVYTGSGIILEARLSESFLEFMDEIGNYPEDGQRYSVDRIDTNLGYVTGNLRWATPEQQARNRRMSSLNTSGVTGVSWRYRNGYCSAVARVNSLDGGRYSREFSAGKYGKEEAFRLACEWRDQRIKELNSFGAGYTESHGKEKVHKQTLKGIE